ncbi:MAG: metalloregulator ArsR/SmtB family transcription factor [Eubacteriales bacterium]|nr:metalloregulator ArsR/SmtB family transcription factor [Eubacteriales bacterium]
MNEITLPHNHNAHTVYSNIKNELDNIEKFQLVADIFKQLGDTTRIRLFWLLCHCEECVINISAMLDMSSPAVSHHLRLLRSSGLIVSRRDGKEVYYHAADTEQSRLLHKMIEQVIEITCPS